MVSFPGQWHLCVRWATTGAMPRFAANLNMLFTEHPLPDRFAATHAAGFEAVEMLFPYALPVQELKAHLRATGLGMVLINTPAGDWDAGERGFAAVPGAESTFWQGFETALGYAMALDRPLLHVMAGMAEGRDARDAFVANLRRAVRAASDQPMTIEPINPIDMPGYFLNDFEQAAAILAEVDAPNLGLQFDAYHAHCITGDVPGTWARFGPLVSHVQIAGAPGRHEPVGGEIDYPAFFAALEASRYDGVVSCEYVPAHRTEEGLGWMTQGV